MSRTALLLLGFGALCLLPTGAAWEQLHGGPERSGIALVPEAPLDVVRTRNVLAAGENISTVVGPNLVLTPHGLVGVARNNSTGDCTMLRVAPDLQGPVGRFPLAGCHAAWMQGYDPATDLLLVCSILPADGPVLQALEVATGKMRWAVRPGPDFGVADAQGVLFWGCSGAALDLAEREVIVPFLNGKTGADIWRHRVAAIDLDSGAVKWASEVPATAIATGSLLPAGSVDGASGSFIPLSATVTSTGILVTAVVICPDVVTCEEPSMDGSQPAPFQVATAWLSRDGVVQGIMYARAEPRAGEVGSAFTSRTASGAFWATAYGPQAAVSSGGYIVLVNPADREWLAQAPVSTIERAEWGADTLASPSWGPDGIYVPFYRTLTVFDPVDLSKRWAWATREPGWLVADVMPTPTGTVYVLLVQAERSSRSTQGLQTEEALVVKLDARAGAEREVQRLPLRAQSWMTTEADLAIPGLGQGFSWPRPPAFVPVPDGLVVSDLAGNVVLLAESDPALRPRLEIDRYPSAGQSLEVQVAPPSGRDAREVLVRWGDGGTAESAAAGAGPGFTFRHAFGTPARYEVLATVVYPDGLTGTATAVVDVGGTPPPELNAIQQAFTPENQNWTFFIMGLVLTGIGGLWGLLRLRRQKAILQRELRAIHQTVAAARSRPAECEQALGERRAHAHVLLEDGRIDEAGFHVLERRIESLQRDLRTQVLDERFDFLPRGLARRLEDLLADGKVTAWEREAFERLLRQDRFLTEAQKRQVRELVHGWSRRDAA